LVKRILFIFILLVSTFSFSQLSKNHYIPPISSGPSNADPLDQLMYISTPSQGDVNFTINIVGGNSISGTVSNATPYVYGIADSFPTGIYHLTLERNFFYSSPVNF